MRQKETGQVLLIVVLILIVVLTVGLSIASRSITSLRTSTQEAASQKALDAAEAGVEQALRSGASRSANFGIDTNLSYITTVDEVSDKEIFLNGGNIVPKDDGIDLWLSKYSDDTNEIYTSPIGGSMVVLWGDPNKTTDCTGNPPAIEIAVLYDRANPYIKRFTYDSCKVSRENNFSLPNTSDSPNFYIDFKSLPRVTYKYKTDSIDLANAFLARITPYYASTIIGAKKTEVNPSPFPSQGTLVTSTGTARNEGTTRTIQVFQGYPKIPTELFPFTIFSP